MTIWKDGQYIYCIPGDGIAAIEIASQYSIEQCVLYGKYVEEPPIPGSNTPTTVWSTPVSSRDGSSERKLSIRTSGSEGEDVTKGTTEPTPSEKGASGMVDRLWRAVTRRPKRSRTQVAIEDSESEGSNEGGVSTTRAGSQPQKLLKFKEQLQTLQDQVEQYKTRVNTSEERTQRYRAKYGQVVRKLTDEQGRIEELEKHLHDLTDRHRQDEKQLEESRSSYQQIQQKHKEIMGRLELDTKKIQEMEEKLEERNEDIPRRYKVCQEELLQCKKDLESSRQKIENNKHWEDCYFQYHQKHDEARTALINSKNNIRTLEQQIKDREEELNEVRAQSQEREQSMMRDKKEGTTRINTLEHRLCESERQCERLMRLVDTQNKEIKKLSEKESEANIQLGKLTWILQSRDQEIDSLSKRLEHVHQELDVERGIGKNSWDQYGIEREGNTGVPPKDDEMGEKASIGRIPITGDPVHIEIPRGPTHSEDIFPERLIDQKIQLSTKSDPGKEITGNKLGGSNKMASEEKIMRRAPMQPGLYQRRNLSPPERTQDAGVHPTRNISSGIPSYLQPKPLGVNVGASGSTHSNGYNSGWNTMAGATGAPSMNVSGDSVHLMGLMMQMMQESSARDERREDRLIEALKSKENKDDRDAGRVKHDIKTTLTMKELRKGNSQGLKHLNEWLHDMILNCPREELRVALVPYTVDPDLIQDLKLEEGIKAKTTTWEEIRAKLMALVPKVEHYEAETTLLRTFMEPFDDVLEFASRIRGSYAASCQLLGVTELDTSLADVLADTMTGRMNPEAKNMFVRQIRKDPEYAVKKLEVCLRNKAYKDVLFPTISKSTGGGNRAIHSSSTKPGGIPTTLHTGIAMQNHPPLGGVPGSNLVVATPTYAYPGSSSVNNVDPTRMTQNTGNSNQAVFSQIPLNQTTIQAAPQQNPTPGPSPSRNPFPGSTSGEGHPSGRQDYGTNTNRGPYSGTNNNTGRTEATTRTPWRESAYATTRRETLRGWQDWCCVQCGSRNPATWYICNQPACDGATTERQQPRDSWKCIRSCGQTNYAKDHFCYCCLRPNPGVSADRLRTLPSHWEGVPREGQRWMSRPPVLLP